MVRRRASPVSFSLFCTKAWPQPDFLPYRSELRNSAERRPCQAEEDVLACMFRLVQAASISKASYVATLPSSCSVGKASACHTGILHTYRLRQGPNPLLLRTPPVTSCHPSPSGRRGHTLPSSGEDSIIFPWHTEMNSLRSSECRE